MYGLQPMVESLKQQVYQNLNGMIPMDDLSVIGAPVPMANLHNYPLKSASLALPCVDIPLLHQGMPFSTLFLCNIKQ